MPDTHTGLQLCPTRIDRAAALFAHKVTQSQCQDRQRGQYHKCFTCAYNNAYVQLHGKPNAIAPVASKPANIQVG